MERTERYRGCLLGLAVGDAVGTALEFMRPGTFAPIEDMTGGGPFQLAPGQWTDDTSMALCLAESLVECRAFDPADQMRRYVRWYRDGYLSSTGRCFDIGMTTSMALRRYEETGAPYSGSTSVRASGNGSLMRLAPVPLAFAHAPAEAIELSGDSSRTTHGSVIAVDACRYFGGLIAGAASGASKDALLSYRYAPAPGYWQEHRLCPEIDAVTRGSFKEKQPPEIRGTGYVAQTLEAALWAFHNSADFREGCLMAANLGDDADTTAAIYGQIAGVFYGENGIPAPWRTRLHEGEAIAALGAQLCRLAQNPGLSCKDARPATDISEGG